MSRLTKKYFAGYTYSGETKSVKEFDLWVIEAENKLGKLEDLEEQIGCPLDVLFKALDKGFYFNNKHGKLANTNDYFRPLLNGNNILIQEYIDNGGGCWYQDYMYLYVKDYKKTWWLRKDKSE